MKSDMKRYDRQTRLPEIGMDGQKKLLEASVLCIGAGGLGSPALLYLAAAGIGRIGIIDFDRVDESNLQRQVLFSSLSVGKPKASEAAERLRALNPGIQIDAFDEELTPQTADKLFPLYDIILDGTDNFETKFLINDAALRHEKPWIYGAIQGFEGQVSVFNYKDGPCYRCLYPEKPTRHVPSCAEAGVIGAVAGLVGVTQALQAIQVIVDHGRFEPLSGRVLLLDARTMQTRVFQLPRNQDCRACSGHREEIVLSYASPVCAFTAEISPAQLKERSGHMLIDVREREEWEQGFIEGALLWPLSEIMQGRMQAVPKQAEIILYCKKGVRSLQAAEILKTRGFTDLTSLSGGYEAWLAEKRI